MKLNKNEFGFTLAETLITLGVIGVVAAITVPVIISKFEHASNVAALKKAYSIILQANTNLQEEYGQNVVALCEENDSECLGKLFAEKLKVVSEQLFIPNEGFPIECWEDTISRNAHEPQYCIVTADGIAYSFDMEWKNQSAILRIDINGSKGPNQWGKDKYIFIITNNKITPYISTICQYGKGDYVANSGCAYVYLYSK